MKSIRLIPALLCVSVIYFSCGKHATPVTTSASTQSRTASTRIDQVKENVTVPFTITDSLGSDSVISDPGRTTITTTVNNSIIGQLSYDGYTRQYTCGTPGTYTYTYTWEVLARNNISSVQLADQLVIGSLSATATVQLVSSTANGPMVNYVFQAVVSGIPEDDNYCNDTIMSQSITINAIRLPGGAVTATASYSEDLSPDTYIIDQFEIVGYSSLGNNQYQLSATALLGLCGPQCHVSALGFSPSITLYYHLVGSSNAWSTLTINGDDTNFHTFTVTGAGTYEFYTEGELSPGVESGELYYGTINVQ